MLGGPGGVLHESEIEPISLELVTDSEDEEPKLPVDIVRELIAELLNYSQNWLIIYVTKNDFIEN